MKKNDSSALPLLLFSLSLLADISIAQTSEQAQIDLLVFRHTMVTEEQINDIASVPPLPGEITWEGGNLPDVPPNATGEENEIRIITTNGLEEQAKKIQASEFFEFLYRISWRQPVYTPQDARYIPLAPKKHTGLLQAAVKVAFERYFRLDMDLLYDPHIDGSRSIEQDAPENQPLFIRMQEVITDDALYYLDHPLLGVIVKVSVVKDAGGSG